MTIGWKILAGLLLLAGLIGAEQAYEKHLIAQGDKVGYARATGEWAAQEKAVQEEMAFRLAEAAKDAKAAEMAMQEAFQKQAESRQKDKNDAAKNLDVHVAAAVARTERLSVRTAQASCPAAGGAPAADPAAAGGPGAEARTELLPETAIAVFGIAADIAGLVRERNDLVDHYNAARAACNK